MGKHPRLKDRFQLLYTLKLNPKIKNNIDLGVALGVSKQSISRWCAGTSTTRGNEIPLSRVESVADQFQIKHEWFSLPFPEFEECVRGLIEERENPKSDLSPKVSIAALPITNIEMIGREEELEFLDKCWSSSKINFVEVVAFGGTGKSSLINKWLSDFRRDHYRKAKRVYAWSFYWQGHSSDVNSSGDYFIEHALTWFGDESPTSGTPWGKATRLANLIRESNTLLILDGLEPIQYPPGKKHGQIDNPAVSFLIRELASETQGLIIVTTRYSVADIAAYDDGRVAKLELSNLSIDAGSTLLKNQGVIGEVAQFRAIVESYCGHPLSLNLIAGYLSKVHDGRLDRLPSEHCVLADVHHESHVQNILSEYMGWLVDTPKLQLLRLISLIDKNIKITDLIRLINHRSIVGLTDRLCALDRSGWGYCVSELLSANLLSAKNEVLETHPLIKDFMLTELSSQTSIQREGHELIFRYFKSEARDNSTNSYDQELLYRSVIHANKAGLYGQAFEIYFVSIKKGYMIPQCSHSIDQKCIKSFFGGDWRNSPQQLSDDSVYFLLSSAAVNLTSLGELEESIELSFECMNFYIQNDKFREAILMAGPLISMLIIAGQLEKAMSVIESMSVPIQKIGNPVLSAMGNNFWAYACHLNGRVDEAKMHFELGEEVLNSSISELSVGFPTISAYYCKFLLDNGNPKDALERLLKTFAWRVSKSWQVRVDTASTLASDVLVLGLTFLALGDKINARVQLDKQVEIFRAADEWLFLPTGLNSRARLYLAMGDLESANRDLQESIEISERIGTEFGKWEAYLDLAQLNFTKREYELASEYLEKAKAIPGMNAYKFRDREIHDLEVAIRG